MKDPARAPVEAPEGASFRQWINTVRTDEGQHVFDEDSGYSPCALRYAVMTQAGIRPGC